MEHRTHDNHDHTHQEGCGHTAVEHDGHVDYIHDGHLHSVHGDHVDEHALSASANATCNEHDCDDHADDHRHGASCGHEAVPHGDHTDYVVNEHLHHAHDEHCDDHGPVAVRRQA